jgi:DNA invertase Pin-like site-specific DNA recombinase
VSEYKITASHLRRAAVIYVRQSTLAQVERNSESTMRQYDLAGRARQLGWPRTAVQVIDEDLGVSGASAAGRSGFAELAARVGLGEVGIVLALEVSRLARNNSDWYRLLDLAGMADTLIADADGIYHPAMFNDRLLLGMKGTMSEAELHILRSRLDGGIRNKAARGELRRGLPAGLVWGEGDGEILQHPDEAVRGVITVIFDQFAARGSVRAVWLHLRDQGLKLPLQRHGHVTLTLAAREEITWVDATYHAVHNVLTHPAYAGAYTYGRTRQEKRIGDGALRIRRRVLPQSEWQVLIKDHHRGYIDWDTYQANQAKIGQNIRPMAHQPGTGAVREGCGVGRRPPVRHEHHDVRHHIPGRYDLRLRLPQRGYDHRPHGHLPGQDDRSVRGSGHRHESGHRFHADGHRPQHNDHRCGRADDVGRDLLPPSGDQRKDRCGQCRAGRALPHRRPREIHAQNQSGRRRCPLHGARGKPRELVPAWCRALVLKPLPVSPDSCRCGS